MKSFFSLRSLHLFPVFLAVLVLHALAGYWSFQLQPGKPAIIGIASWQGADVQSRVNFFLVALVLFSIMVYTGYRYIHTLTSLLSPPVVILLQLFSGLYLFLELAMCCGADTLEAQSFTLAMIWPVVFVQATGNRARISLYEFFWVLLASLNIVFLLRWISAIEGNLFWAYYHNVNWVLISVLLLGILSFIKIQWNKKGTDKFFTVTRRVQYITICCIVATEIFLIVHTRNPQSGLKSPLVVFIPLWLVYMLVSDWRYRKQRKPRNWKFLFRVTLFTVILPAVYTPVYYQTNEMFELANPANGIMRLFEFGEVPVFQSFSSHLLSEQWYGWLYVLFNGYQHSLGFLSYAFFDELIFIVLLTCVLWKITRSRTLTLFVVLFFPFTDFLIPQGFWPVFITALLAFRLYQHSNVKNHAWLTAWALFLLVWKIDLGVANMAATGFFMVWNAARKFTKQKMYALLIGCSAATLAFLLLMFGMAAWLQVDLGDWSKKVLQYISAQQAHGYEKIAQSNDRFYYFHYFLSPAIAVGICIFMLMQVKKQGWAFSHVLVVILCLVYFFNFQRGLVRHSLYEGTDMFVSSMLYLAIFCTAIIYILPRYKWVLPFAFVFFVSGFRYPAPVGSKSQVDRQQEYIINQLRFNRSWGAKRVIANEEFYNASVKPLHEWMDANFGKNKTFLDFSNSPMLYYYLQRELPGLFNQSLQNLVTEKGQLYHLQELDKKDIPVVIWSSVPANWYDQTDGIPNAIRYNIIREYIYYGYVPYGKIGNYYVWVHEKINQDKLRKQNLVTKTALPVLHTDLFWYASQLRAESTTNRNIKLTIAPDPHMLEMQLPEITFPDDCISLFNGAPTEGKLTLTLLDSAKTTLGSFECNMGYVNEDNSINGEWYNFPVGAFWYWRSRQVKYIKIHANTSLGKISIKIRHIVE